MKKTDVKRKKSVKAAKVLAFSAAALKIVETASRELNYLTFKAAPRASLTKGAAEPEHLKHGNVSGYCTGDRNAERAILIFGGSFDTAYNTVVKYGKLFPDCFVCAFDYYGCGKSGGKMRLATMKMTAEDAADAVLSMFPADKVTVMGYSYGCGMAAYLASQKEVSRLILVAGYRDSADLYNIYTPVFYGPFKIIISQNIDVRSYAGDCRCRAFVIGSRKDRQLGERIQRGLAKCFPRCDLRIFDGIGHRYYFRDERVIRYIRSIIGGDYDDHRTS